MEESKPKNLKRMKNITLNFQDTKKSKDLQSSISQRLALQTSKVKVFNYQNQDQVCD